MAVPQLQQKGVPFLRTASDILNFVSKYNPRSSFRQMQIAAQGPSPSVKGVSLVAEAEAEADASWSQVVQIWQRLLDEHSQHLLLAAYEQASMLKDKQQQRAVTLSAQQRMLASSFSVKEMFAAAENLYLRFNIFGENL
jgi:hypothetical protein